MTATLGPRGIPQVHGILHRGEALEAKRDRFTAPAVKAIRYADPAAWMVATAIANATQTLSAELAEAHDRVGLIVTSAEGAVEATAAMAEAAREGSSSPIRFPASNAGSLAGLSSIAFGFRGPTLMLTMPPAGGVPVAVLLAQAWLRREIAAYVVIAACAQPAGERPRARCLLLGPTLLASPDPPSDPGDDVAWLAAVVGSTR